VAIPDAVPRVAQAPPIRARSMIAWVSRPCGRVPNACPQSPSSRVAQKASATAEWRSSRLACNAKAIISTTRRATGSSAAGLAGSPWQTGSGGNCAGAGGNRSAVATNVDLLISGHFLLHARASCHEPSTIFLACNQACGSTLLMAHTVSCCAV
jgi:hypothetical protein